MKTLRLKQKRWLNPGGVGLALAAFTLVGPMAVQAATFKAPVTFQNTNRINIRDGAQTNSTINVSGINASQFFVTKITVSLLGLSHTHLDDLDVLLVGPQGQTTMLMSDSGGGNRLSNGLLTFSATATNNLPDYNPITSGSYKPTNWGNPKDPFSGATTGSSNAWNTNLSIFNNKNPNGIWKLFVVDDRKQGTLGQNVGKIAGGWKLNITLAAVPVPPAVWLFGSALVGLALIGRRSDMQAI
jgi:subtilisin-like proprotein convertase family protein